MRLLWLLFKNTTLSHNGMARPQVADEATTLNIEDNCEYIEEAVADSRQGVVLHLGSWARC